MRLHMPVARQHDNCSVLEVGNEDSQLTEWLIAALLRMVDIFFFSWSFVRDPTTGSGAERSPF